MAEALKNVIAQSLDCPVCLNTFTDPKILSCSHTYCKTCLDDVFECHGNDQMLRYPVCRAETQVPNQDISKLATNLALKCLIEDVKNQYQFYKSIEELKSKADKKHSCFQKYVDFIDEQKDCVSNVQKQCIDNINKAYEESVRQLTEKKEILIGEVKGRTEAVKKELDEMKESAEEHITHLTTKAEVVTNRTKVPSDMYALVAHDTLCQELQEALKQEDPDYKQPRQSSKKGKSVSFKRNVGMDELGLGKIVNAVAMNIVLPTKDSMNTMVNTSDGMMAVGCCRGGLEIFSADGHHQQTVLKDVKIRRLRFLSDGRYVVLDCSNNIILYTLEYTQLTVRFETLSHDEGGLSSLTVDCDDQIYVSYRKAKKIQVFSPEGGKPMSEIPCDGYEPQQITSYNDHLITRSRNAIRLIDKQGVVKYQLTKLGYRSYAAVSQGNSILIAKLKRGVGLVSIDEYTIEVHEYTYELKHIQNLVNDYKIEKPERNWYYLQQYRSGEIAFCTPDRLYIFH